MLLNTAAIPLPPARSSTIREGTNRAPINAGPQILEAAFSIRREVKVDETKTLVDLIEHLVGGVTVEQSEGSPTPQRPPKPDRRESEEIDPDQPSADEPL